MVGKNSRVNILIILTHIHKFKEKKNYANYSNCVERTVYILLLALSRFKYYII